MAASLVVAVVLGGCSSGARSGGVKRPEKITGMAAPVKPVPRVTLVTGDGLPGESYAEVTSDGAWCWFGDPRAVTIEGEHSRTFVGHITSDGDVVVAQYDHDTLELTHSVLKPELQQDDHANPSILVRDDGRLVVFYCGHRGRWMMYRTSAEAGDIGAWGRERAASGHTSAAWGYTYPNPVALSSEGGKRYVFWRGTEFLPMVATSERGGDLAWSEPVAVVTGGGDTPYMKVVSDGDSTIHFALTGDHPRDGSESGVHYFRYEAGSFRRADGTVIGEWDDLPLALADCDLVYDAEAVAASAWVWDIALDAGGLPVIAYSAFPSDTNHRYRYAHWDGGAWADSEIIGGGGWFPSAQPGSRNFEPYYSGGLALDHENPSTVYLSRPVDGVFEIERWMTSDGGATWSVEAVTSGSASNNVRPVVPRGRLDGGPNLIWMNGPYKDFLDYGTSLRMK